MVLLAYPPREEAVVRSVNLVPRTYASGAIRVALVGAGGFAQSMHLPNMERLKKSFQLRAVMSRTGATAKAVAKQFGASYATTDFSQVLKDPDVDLVLIATRHDLHARMVLEALKAGKSVFVEKPLAIAREELSLISDFFAQTQNPPVLMTGFNRRFSPAMQRAKEVLRGRMTPLIVNYRMNAGYIPLDVWVHGAEGGGRNIGEACHIYDLFNFFTDAAVESVHATAIAPTGKQWARNDNFVATVAYTDGSVCTLTYTALGDNSHPKERMDIYGDGKVISMDNFTQLTIAGGKFKGWSAATADKGQLPELKALASCMLHGGHWPISLDQQLQATTISFEVERQIRCQE